MKITRKQLRQWCACYTDARIAALVPEDGLTPLEVAKLDIPAEDRLWVLLREEIIPAHVLRLLACDWATEACRAAGWNDERSLETIAVARRFACGEATVAELAAAWSAAAARPARMSAAQPARWAARSTALAAAEEARLAAEAALSAAAAWWTGSAAAWLTATAWSARSAGARLAAAAEQIADVVRVLRKEGETP